MKKLNNNELVFFCSQLAMILRSGISSIEGIAIIKEDLPQEEGREILDHLYQELEMTGILHEAMRKVEVFPEYVCNMTEIGEQSGRLDEVMEGLADYYEREEDLSQSMKSALGYPALMLGTMAVVVLILVMKVMPIFQQVFEQLGGGLSGISKGIMDVGIFMSRYSIWLAVLLVLAAAGGIYVMVSEKGRNWLGRWMEQTRFFGNITEKMACARAAQAMNLCMRSGLDLDQSLEMTGRLVEHGKVQKKVEICRNRMMEGASFDEAMEESRLFTGVHGKMLSIGIRTGSADQVMGKIADQYGQEVDEKLQRTVSMIEPVLVAVLAVAVGVILLSVMLPLMGIMSNLG